jgi:hypothetical protein
MATTLAREPAPGSLQLVQKFINSNEMPDGVDELRTTSLAAQWLHAATGVDLAISARTWTGSSPPARRCGICSRHTVERTWTRMWL